MEIFDNFLSINFHNDFSCSSNTIIKKKGKSTAFNDFLLKGRKKNFDEKFIKIIVME